MNVELILKLLFVFGMVIPITIVGVLLFGSWAPLFVLPAGYLWGFSMAPWLFESVR